MPKASFFLQITASDGERIKGEAEEEGFEGAIEVTSWDWSVSDKLAKDMMTKSSEPTTGGTGASGSGSGSGSGAGAGGARHGEAGEKSCQPTPVRFSKMTDRATIRLLTAMYNDEKFDEVKFSLRQRWRSGLGGSGLGLSASADLGFGGGSASASARLSLGGGGGAEANEMFLLELVLTKARVTGYDFDARSQNLDVELDENWEFSYDKLYYDFKSAPGRYMVGPGMSVEFGPTDPKTKAPKKPDTSKEDQSQRLARLEAENEKLRRDVKKN